jgi:hypothetical protein
MTGPASSPISSRHAGSRFSPALLAAMPTRKTFFWLTAALVMYLIAWNIGSGWLYIITAMLISFPLLSLLLSRLNTHGIELQQTTAESSFDGGCVKSTVIVTHHSHIPRFFLEVDCQFGGSRQQFFVPKAGGGRLHNERLVFEGLRRGIYPGADITVSSSAPIGLAKSHRKKTTNCPLIVYPTWRHLGTDWDTGYTHTGLMRSSSIPTRSASSDYLGVRDYRSEDSPRSIHWRTTARYNRLTVIEYARQAAMSPVFILDTWNGMGGCNEAFEAAVSSAASLVEREESNNRRFAIGSSPTDAAGRGLGHDCDEALFWLAGVEAVSERPLELNDSLPWQEVTPVLLLSSHTAYNNIHQCRLFDEHPHTIVIVFDIRGFNGDKTDPANVMSDVELAALSYNLDQCGSRLFVIDNANNVMSCLESL